MPNTHRCRGESQFIELYVFTFSLLLQVIYFLLDVRIWAADTGVMVTLTDVPLEVWLIALLWPLVILVLGEAVKLIEIR